MDILSSIDECNKLKNELYKQKYLIKDELETLQTKLDMLVEVRAKEIKKEYTYVYRLDFPLIDRYSFKSFTFSHYVLTSEEAMSIRLQRNDNDNFIEASKITLIKCDKVSNEILANIDRPKPGYTIPNGYKIVRI